MTPIDPSAVAHSIARIQQRIRALAGDRSVQLIAVTKGFGTDAIRAAMAAGCTLIGENYAQELVAKLGQLASEPPPSGAVAPVPEVHFIGRLQTNKVRQLAGVVDVWQSVDRASLLDEIARRAPLATVFIQVNATGEDHKGGCRPDQVEMLVERGRVGDLHVEGLMAVGPTVTDLDRTRAAFTLVRRLADDNGLTGASMGMTDDMDIAIGCGATHLRIGRALFGVRPQPRTRIG